jgi:hypothetical protein
MISELEISAAELKRQIPEQAIRYGFEEVIDKLNEVIRKLNSLDNR